MSEATSSSKPDIEVYDTKLFPPREAFDRYRDAVSKSLVPALADYISEDAFRARHEAVLLRAGLFGKISCTPHTIRRTVKHCADTEVEGYFVVHQLVGGTVLVKGDHMIRIAQGDTVIVDSRDAITGMMAKTPFNAVSGIIVPRAPIEAIVKHVLRPNGMVIIGNRTPLANCLSLLANCVSIATLEELECIYEACLDLLPIELKTNSTIGHDRSGSSRDRLLRRILVEIDNNLHSDISPTSVAEQFDISVRYIHKLFIGTGTTFNAYLLTRRLEAVYNELRTASDRRVHISSLAYKWGFKEISTFNRAFRKRYGTSPKQVNI